MSPDESRTDAVRLSRRSFCVAGGQTLALVSLPVAAAAQPRPTTPLAIISSLASLADAELIAGRPDAKVAGVALLADPTLAALRQAVATRASLILSLETPFYSRPADPAAAKGPFAAIAASAVAALHDSPAYKAKQAFVADHDLTIYRLYPHAGARNTAAEAIAARLGWATHRRPGEQAIYRPPGLTVGSLVQRAHTLLGASGGLRFIGDPAMPIDSVLVVPGSAEVVSTTQALRNVQALLTGDVREWEVVTYIHDSIDAGLPKALVATGRILSEQPFVERCALALRHAFPQVSIHAALQADPFWRVQA